MVRPFKVKDRAKQDRATTIQSYSETRIQKPPNSHHNTCY